jgi:prepilin-type N-terminal cleavage/methylation domain-containing protein
MTRRGSQRRGFTLVEMMAVISMGTVLSGALAVTVSRVVRVHADAAQRTEDFVAIGQLAEQFRRDVHDALRVVSDQGPGPGARLRVELSDGTVAEYELDDCRWQRTQRAGDKVVGRETWDLRGAKIMGWTNDSETSRLITVQVRVLPADGTMMGVARSFEIAAALRRAGGAP